MYTLEEPSHEDTQSNNDDMIVIGGGALQNNTMGTDEANVDFDT
jgi:hypothetical protein